MSEVLSHPSPSPESLPAAPEADTETDTVDQPAEPSFRERANKFADRVGDILEQRVRVKQDQKDAYATYADNIDATKSREKEERSHERKEKAKRILGKLGNSSLMFLESQGLIPPRGEWHKQGKGKLNMDFSAWVARKYVAAKERRSARLAGFLSAEQNAAVMGEANPLTGDAEPEEPTIELPPVPADTSEPVPEPSADTSPETTTPASPETPAEPTEPESRDPEYVERARREAEAQAQAAEEQRRAHEHDVV